MEARAYLRHVRIAPRKVQIVLDLIRNKPADVAMAILKHTPKAACEPVSKLLKSAMANAEQLQHGQEQLVCCRVFCLPRSYPEEDETQSTGQSVSHFKEDFAYYPRPERAGIS